jgi:hypothetical protein
MQIPAPELPSKVSAHIKWIAVFSSIFAFVVCYLRNFVFPHVPILFWNDQMLYAIDGARMAAGQAPYSEYFLFLTPGTDLVYAGLFRWLGVSLWIPDLAMVCLATIAIFLLTLAAAKVLHSSLIAMPAALSIGFVLYGGMDATHHWYSTVIVMGAMLVLLGGSEDWRIALAGALCGLAASFTQSKGGFVTAGFILYLFVQSLPKREAFSIRWRRCLLLCGTALGSFLIINGNYMWVLGLREWFKWIVLFSLRYYPTTPGQNWHFWEDLQNHQGAAKWICGSFLYILVPLTYLISIGIIYCRCRDEKSEASNRLLLITITGVAMLLAVAPSSSVMRLSSASLPATILMSWLISRGNRFTRAIGAALAAFALVIALYLPIRTQTVHWRYLELPAGRTAFSDSGKFDLYRWMSEHTHPGQVYFGIAPLSLPLRLQCPAPIQAPGPWEYYRPEHILASINAIERYKIPLLVLRPNTQYIGSWGYRPGYLDAYDAYLKQHYRPVRTFSTGDVVWQRKDILSSKEGSSAPSGRP